MFFPPKGMSVFSEASNISLINNMFTCCNHCVVDWKALGDDGQVSATVYLVVDTGIYRMQPYIFSKLSSV